MTTTIQWRKYRDEQPTTDGTYLLRRHSRVDVVQYDPASNTWRTREGFTVSQHGPRMTDLWAPYADLSVIDPEEGIS